MKDQTKEGEEKHASAHLDAMAHIVQDVVIDGLPDVPDRPLHVGRSDDLMGPGCVLVGGQDPDLPPGNLLFVDVHGLKRHEEEMVLICLIQITKKRYKNMSILRLI